MNAGGREAQGAVAERAQSKSLHVGRVKESSDEPDGFLYHIGNTSDYALRANPTYAEHYFCVLCVSASLR